MAHFAELKRNSEGQLIVDRVIVVSNEDLKKKAFWDPLGLFTGKEESEKVGIAFCQNLLGKDTIWRQCSYNAGSDGKGFRGNYTGAGALYMTDVETLGVASTDVFMEPQPHPSWHIGLGTAQWYPPDDAGNRPKVSFDEDHRQCTYKWNEENYWKDPKTAWVFNDPETKRG